MPSHVARIQPFRATDGADESLLAFAVTAALRLDGTFLPADSLSDWATEPASADDVVLRTRRYGAVGRGFRISHEQGYAQERRLQAVDRVTVEADGLRDATLVLECTRSWYAPRFLELRVSAADEASVQDVVQSFHDRFGHGNAPTTAEIPTVVRNARAAVAAGEWESAAMFATAALETDPRQAEALLYLGVASGALGDLSAAEEALVLSLQLDPDQYDAWYNLGALHQNRGNPRQAILAFQESLRIRPGNHAVLFQLGRVYEAVGETARATEAYQAAIENAPNPHGYWGYRGADYTEQARQALARLSR